MWQKRSESFDEYENESDSTSFWLMRPQPNWAPMGEIGEIQTLEESMSMSIEAVRQVRTIAAAADFFFQQNLPLKFNI